MNWRDILTIVAIVVIDVVVLWYAQGEFLENKGQSMDKAPYIIEQEVEHRK